MRLPLRRRYIIIHGSITGSLHTIIRSPITDTPYIIACSAITGSLYIFIRSLISHILHDRRSLHLPVKHSLHRLKLKTAVLKLLNLLKQFNLFFRVISMPHFIPRNIQIKLILPVSEHMCLDSGALCNFRYYVPFFFHL